MKRRITVICIIILLLAGSLFSLKSLYVTNRLGIWYPAKDRHFTEYNEFIDKYGNDELTVIGIHSDTGFSDKSDLDFLRKAISELDTVSYTESPISFISPLLSEKAKWKFISEDRKSAVIFLNLNKTTEAEEHRDDVLKSIRAIMAETPFEIHIAGVTAVYSELNHITVTNVSVFMMISFLMIFSCAAFLLRSLRMLALAGFSIIISVIFTLGLMSLFNVPLNMITSMIPVLILIYGLSDVIYLHYSAKGKDIGLKHLLVPCFLTSLTTAIGYSGLLTSDIPCIKELGVWGGTAVMIEFAVTAVFFMTFRTFFSKSSEPLKFSALMKAKERLMIKNRAVVIVLSILVIIILGLGMRNLKFDTNTMEFFKKGNRVRTSAEWISENVMNTLPFEMLLHYDNPSELTQMLDSLQSEIESKYGYTSVSMSDFNIMGMIAGANSDVRYVQQNDKTARVTIFLPMMSANNAKTAMDSLLAFSEMQTGRPVSGSGYLPLYSSLVDYIQQSQTKSFAVSFIAIFIIIALLFSVRASAASVIPNLLPVMGVLGIMGFAGVRLDVGTVIITPIILGIVVDDTIHMLYAKKHGRHSVKLPMFATSLSLVIGFSFLIFAQLTTIMLFGIFSAIAVLLAYIGDAFILPVMLGKGGSDDFE